MPGRDRGDSGGRPRASLGPEVQRKICRLRRKFAGLTGAPERSCRPQFSGARTMTASIVARLAALKAAPTPNLKAMWRQFFETEPPPYNRRFLESRLAY